MRMGKEIVLIVDSEYHFDLPTNAEIKKSFPALDVIYENSLDKSIGFLKTDECNAIVMKYPSNSRDRRKLVKTISSLTPNPGIIIIDDIPGKHDSTDTTFDNACVFVKDDSNIKQNFLSALETALKCYRLNLKLYNIHSQMQENQSKRDIVSMTLSYNSEINNLLTAIIGNIQLIMQSATAYDSGTLDKLTLIDENAQKIQHMALNFVDTLNANPGSLPVDD